MGTRLCYTPIVESINIISDLPAASVVHNARAPNRQQQPDTTRITNNIQYSLSITKGEPGRVILSPNNPCFIHFADKSNPTWLHIQLIQGKLHIKFNDKEEYYRSHTRQDTRINVEDRKPPPQEQPPPERSQQPLINALRYSQGAQEAQDIQNRLDTIASLQAELRQLRQGVQGIRIRETAEDIANQEKVKKSY